MPRLTAPGFAFPRALLLVSMLGLSAVTGCRPEASPAVRCARGLNHAFEALADSQRATVEVCVRGVTRGSAGPSGIDACIGADPLGRVAKASARVRAAESHFCPDGAPVLGAAGAEAAIDAALAAGPALAGGLFGRDLEAAVSALRHERAAARCQRTVLAHANECAARFLAGYGRCAADALAHGADDPFDLVACKGADPHGVLARACDERIAHGVADVCAGLDTAALFPGCAGDLVRCARAHARRTASLALNRAAGLCADVLPGSLDEAPLLRCFEPPAEEPVVYRDVPTPPGVIATAPEWDESGEHLVFSFTAPSVAGTQLARMREDGSDFRCLSCGSAITGNLRPVQLFSDGRRVLVAGPNNPVPRWNVLECTPSLLDCQSSVLVPIQLPPNPDPATPILQYRVPHVTRDDAWFLWTEVRLRGRSAT